MKTKNIKPFATRQAFGGTQKLYKFRNGYGASVVKHPFSYGGKNGKWELAVLAGKQQAICYSTPITSDVLGWLTPQAVQKTLQAIKALPKYK